MEYDAGLLFLGYQRDPRTGFIKIFDNMAKLDVMNQFVDPYRQRPVRLPARRRRGRVHRPEPVRGDLTGAAGGTPPSPEIDMSQSISDRASMALRVIQ